MKKLIFTCLLAAVCMSISAQKKEKEPRFQETQARVVDVEARAYVRPVTVDLRIHGTESGQTPKISEYSYAFTAAQVSALGGDLQNIRSNALFRMCEEFHANAIVGAMFNVKAEGVDIKNGCIVEIKGFPADFVNWKPAEEKDYKWIEMDVTRTVTEKNFQATMKLSQAGVVVTK